MKTLWQYIGYLIAGILLYFLIKPFLQTHTAVKDATFEIHSGWLICSFGTILFYWSAYLTPFATLLSRLAEKPVSFRDAFTLFHLANITRYLPGRIWGVVRLLSLSRRFGLSKTAVGSSLTLHVGIETAIGGLIGLSLLFSPKMRDTASGLLANLSGHTPMLGLACVGVLLCGLLFLFPKVARHARQLLKTFLPLLKDTCLWVSVLVSHGLLWLCQAFAFFLFVRSFTPVQWADAGILTACFAFAWVLGFLSFLTPGGLGIREGLLSLLLAHAMPASQATLVALLCRVWMLSAEMLLAGTAFFIHRRYSERQNDTHNL